MKRALILVFAFVLMAALLLAACDGGTTEESKGNSSAAMSEGASENSANESFAWSEAVSEWVSEDIQEITSQDTSEDSEEESTLESQPGEESSQPEEEPKEPPMDAVKLLYTRYTGKPSFVIIGTCAMNAEITAKLGDQEITVPSYMGWYAVTLKAVGEEKQEITLSQKVDGEDYDIPRTFSVKVVTPQPMGTTALASNDAFQFFLAQMIPDHMRTARLFSDSEINNMVSRVQGRLNQMREYNEDAEIIYMIIPSPMTTYPELVPEDYPKGSGEGRLDQVTKALSNAGATVIDMRNTFNQHKHDEMPLYYHLDSHWADYGAYLAYVELFEHISEKFPEATPRGMDEFTWTADYYTSADAMLFLSIPQVQIKEYGYYREIKEGLDSAIKAVPRYRGMQLIYSEDTCNEILFNTKRSQLPSCIVFRDSYSAGIYDLIPDRMNRTHYIGMWNYTWNNTYINTEKPDYVIYILAEWNINEVVYR